MQAIFGQKITLVKKQLPSLRLNNHRTYGTTSIFKLTCFCPHLRTKITKLEDYYNLKGIQKQDQILTLMMQN